MVGVASARGSRRLVGDAGGRKVSVCGNEFGVRGGEHFVVGDQRVHHHFVVVDGGGKVVHAVVQIFYEDGQLGRDCCVLGPGELTSRILAGRFRDAV